MQSAMKGVGWEQGRPSMHEWSNSGVCGWVQLVRHVLKHVADAGEQVHHAIQPARRLAMHLYGVRHLGVAADTAAREQTG